MKKDEEQKKNDETYSEPSTDKDRISSEQKKNDEEHNKNDDKSKDQEENCNEHE